MMVCFILHTSCTGVEAITITLFQSILIYFLLSQIGTHRKEAGILYESSMFVPFIVCNAAFPTLYLNLNGDFESPHQSFFGLVERIKKVGKGF